MIVGIFCGFVLRSALHGITFGLIAGLVVSFFSEAIAVLKSVRQEKVIEPPSTLFQAGWNRLPLILVTGGCGWLGFVIIYSLQSGGVNPVAVTYGLTTGFFLSLIFSIWSSDWIPALGREIQPAISAG